MQEVLSVTTKSESLRAEIQGWTHEDPSLYVNGKDIGHTRRPRPSYTPENILQALASGWKLLGPPQPFEQVVHDSRYLNLKNVETHYSWWLVKDKV